MGGRPGLWNQHCVALASVAFAASSSQFNGMEARHGMAGRKLYELNLSSSLAQSKWGHMCTREGEVVNPFAPSLTLHAPPLALISQPMIAVVHYRRGE